MNNDTTFVSWNKATFSALKNGVQSAIDSSQKMAYENRLLAFKSFLEIEGDNKINPQSIRYKFLDELTLNINNERKFYVIEANRSGEGVEIRNYLIFLNANDVTDVEVYNFISGKWIKNDKSVHIGLRFEGNLKEYATKFGLGFNQDDVIITEFVNGTVKSSEYYLYGTLSDVGCIRKILSLK